ncbi:MAG: tetratricopeptide repeat protein, partial [Candidatus Paceibacterota bacterium]
MKNSPILQRITILIIFTFISCKQDNELSKKVNSFYDEVYYENLHPNKKTHYLDSIFQLVNKQPNDSITRYEILTLSCAYYYLNEPKLSKSVAEKALTLASESNDSLCMGKAYYYMGDAYDNSKRDSAYYYYLKAEKIYEVLDNKDWIAQMKFNKAYMLFFSGNYSECEVELSKALHLLQNTLNYRLRYNCLNLLGNCLEKSEEYDEANKYHLMALDEIELLKKSDVFKDKSKASSISTTINLCNLHDIRGEYDLSITKLKPLLSNEIRIEFPYEYSVMTGNLANAYMKSGNLKTALPL